MREFDAWLLQEILFKEEISLKENISSDLCFIATAYCTKMFEVYKSSYLPLKADSLKTLDELLKSLNLNERNVGTAPLSSAGVALDVHCKDESKN